MIFFRLFFEFFKTGLFAVGGGMATVPFLMHMGELTGWFTPAELSNMIAVSESTPGPIGVNMASYVGCSVAGIFGSLIATLGLITPSIIVILLIAKVLERFRQNSFVNLLFRFLRAAVPSLIAFALIQVIKVAVFSDNTANLKLLCFFIGFSILVFTCKKVHPIIWILIGAVVGVCCL